MVQIQHEMNFPYWNGSGTQVSNGTMTFFPLIVRDSISLNTFLFGFERATTNSNITLTLSLGMYTLSGSSLSLFNSGSLTLTALNADVSSRGLFDITTFSATTNLTPGNYWFGFLFSTTRVSAHSLRGGVSRNPNNAFPGSFVEGVMSESTNALPSSYATSNLDITGSDAFFIPMIILSA